MTKMGSQQSPAALQSTVDREKVYAWIIELSNSETRENALLELSKKREVVPDLAPMLWHSFGTIASLLQEIINIYPAINPATLTAYQSNRVCNALALLQCVASHPETRSSFLQVSLRAYQRVTHTRALSVLRPFAFAGSRAAVLISVSTHGQQDPSVRVSSIDQFGSDRSLGKDRRAGGDYVLAHYGNHPSVLTHHGKRLRIKQDGGYVHPAEDFARRQRSLLHLPNVRSIQSRRHDFRKDGLILGQRSFRQAVEARGQMLSQTVGQSKVRRANESTNRRTNDEN